jgi:hypothetical protein
MNVGMRIEGTLGLAGGAPLSDDQFEEVLDELTDAYHALSVDNLAVSATTATCTIVVEFTVDVSSDADAVFKGDQIFSSAFADRPDVVARPVPVAVDG